MIKLQVFDPAMCCSTGVCGPRTGRRDLVLAERGALELRYIDEVRDKLAWRLTLIPWQPSRLSERRDGSGSSRRQ